MKIYTGTGDRGKTSLFSGERVSKANLRIEAYGDLDELNSVIGSLTASLGPKHPELVDEFQEIQSDLFVIGSLLATTPDSPSMDTLSGIILYIAPPTEVFFIFGHFFVLFERFFMVSPRMFALIDEHCG